MPKKLILLFSHKLTKIQIQDAKSSLKIIEFVSMPTDLQKQWSNIPTDIDSIIEYLSDIKLWLHDIADANDYVLIQGDFGATYYFVNWAFKNKLIPVYSTTKRIHREKEVSDGNIEIQKYFQHQMYRKYK